MTAQQYLNQAYYIDQQIKEKINKADRLRELSTNISPTLNDVPKSSGFNNQAMSDRICKLADLENEINMDIDRLVDLKKEIEAVIKAVDNPKYQRLLELRYLDFHSWDEIISLMGYSRRHIFRIHSEALRKVKMALNVT